MKIRENLTLTEKYLETLDMIYDTILTHHPKPGNFPAREDPDRGEDGTDGVSL